MALSAEEKDRRRKARNARDRAFHAIYREFSKAEDAGNVEIEARFAPEIEPAQKAAVAIEAEEQAALAEIDRQIATLQDRRKTIKDEGIARYRAAYDVVSAIHDRKRAAGQELATKLRE